MSKRFLFYIKNHSKPIVLTDDCGEEKSLKEIKSILEKHLNQSNICISFETKKDLLIARSSDISVIHVTDDSIVSNKSQQIVEKIIENEMIKYDNDNINNENKKNNDILEIVKTEEIFEDILKNTSDSTSSLEIDIINNPTEDQTVDDDFEQSIIDELDRDLKNLETMDKNI